MRFPDTFVKSRYLCILRANMLGMFFKFCQCFRLFVNCLSSFVRPTIAIKCAPRNLPAFEQRSTCQISLDISSSFIVEFRCIIPITKPRNLPGLLSFFRNILDFKLPIHSILTSQALNSAGLGISCKLLIYPYYASVCFHEII